MPFNVALTGLRAATADLEVTGNNVANASTTGFKKSTVQFGDLYANSYLSGSINQIGDGVRVQSIAQNFGQGNISFTDNNLDLAINGQGFFILDNGGERRYTRAGNFGVDNQGYIVNNTGMRIQGYTANAQGVVGGVLGAVHINNENLAPRRTTGVEAALNLDSTASVLSKLQTRINSADGFEGQQLRLTLPDGQTITYPQGGQIGPGELADTIAELNRYEGVQAADDGNGGISLMLDERITLEQIDGAGNATPVAGETVLQNTFDPTDQNTYNHTTSTTVYDSLGNPHVLSMYFVKERGDGSTASSPWSMYAQIDGRNIGPAGADGNPTMAKYDLSFNADGSLRDDVSKVVISNWTPMDSTGRANGAQGPNGNGEITDPPSSSNFEIDIARFTQYGSAFSVNDMQQDGFTTGRMSGLDVNDDGVIFARYTNGQSRVLAQVALASFKDMEGLASVGETTWVETYKSGAPLIGIPGSASLGNIRANSLEDSNVDLSEQLVNLIVAQRNYQANAKTIETANAVTQTIINLR